MILSHGSIWMIRTVHRLLMYESKWDYFEWFRSLLIRFIIIILHIILYDRTATIKAWLIKENGWYQMKFIQSNHFEWV